MKIDKFSSFEHSQTDNLSSKNSRLIQDSKTSLRLQDINPDKVSIYTKEEERDADILKTYTGHGMIESYPKNMTIAYVVAHEQRHAQHNRMMAFAKGEDVEQDISYSLSFENGRLQANAGVTMSKFTKREDKKNSYSILKQGAGTDEKPAYKKNIEYASLKNNKKRLEEELADMKRDMSIMAGQSSSAKELTLEKSTAIEKVKNRIAIIKKDIEKKDREESGQILLSSSKKEGSNNTKEKDIEKKDHVSIRNISDLFTKAFSFVQAGVPRAALNDSAFSALKIQGSLAELKTIKPDNPFEIDISFDNLILNTRSSRLEELKGKLDAVSSSSEKLLSPDSFVNTAVSSSDIQTLSATTSMDASPGTFEVTPSELFLPHRIVSDAISDTFSQLNMSGSFKVNGYSISVDKTDSLLDISNRINFGEDINNNGSLDLTEDLNGNGSLDILTLGSGETRVIAFEDIDYDRTLDPSEDLNGNERIDGGSGQLGVVATIENNQLLLTSTTFSRIELDDPDGILKNIGILDTDIRGNTILKHDNSTDTGVDLILNQEPQKATLKVDEREFVRDKNVISDIIPGVSIKLKQSSSEPVYLTIKKDVSNTFNLIDDFVKNFNKSIRFINDLLEFKQTLKNDPDIQRIRKDLIVNTTKKVTPISNEASKGKIDSLSDAGVAHISKDKSGISELQITNLLKRFKNSLQSSVSPATGSESIFSRLGEFGILSLSDGTLAVDENRLKTVIKDDIKGIKDLFSDKTDGISVRITHQLDKILNKKTGAINTKQEAIRTTASDKGQLSMERKELVGTLLAAREPIGDIKKFLEDISDSEKR